MPLTVPTRSAASETSAASGHQRTAIRRHAGDAGGSEPINALLPLWFALVHAAAGPAEEGPSSGQPLVERIKGSKIHHLKELRSGS